MRNNDERRAFIENVDNWELTESTIFTQTMKLTYKGAEWYQIRIAEWSHYFDHDALKGRYRFEWENHSRYYKLKAEHGCLEPISKSSIIEEIKTIDKKEREMK